MMDWRNAPRAELDNMPMISGPGDAIVRENRLQRLQDYETALSALVAAVGVESERQRAGQGFRVEAIAGFIVDELHRAQHHLIERRQPAPAPVDATPLLPNRVIVDRTVLLELLQLAANCYGGEDADLMRHLHAEIESGQRVELYERDWLGTGAAE